MNLGIIARADKTGLGNQTRNLVRMLKPFRVMVINSKPFNHNQQFLDTYKGLNTIVVNGFPTDREILQFLRGLHTVLTCELFYNTRFVDYANRQNTRTYNQYNYEFLDHLVNPNLTLPTKLLSPSKWHLEEMQQRFMGRVEYLPPPIFHTQFDEVKEHNMARNGKPRFLHVVGRMAVNDRNGTLDLLESLKYTESNFDLVLKAQTKSPIIESYKDNRLKIDYDSPLDEAELYRDFDALILPRRYAGLCLPMNEALISGMPVIMTDVDPNNKVLPKKWLVESQQVDKLKARTELEVYSANHIELAKKIDWLCSVDLNQEKVEAFELGYNNYSAASLISKYNEIII